MDKEDRHVLFFWLSFFLVLFVIMPISWWVYDQYFRKEPRKETIYITREPREPEELLERIEELEQAKEELEDYIDDLKMKCDSLTIVALDFEIQYEELIDSLNLY